MQMQIKKAERRKQKARVGLFGPSGAGKTYSALLLASGLVPWDKICVIDTERGSASLYEHLGPFSTIELEKPYTPESYVQAINMATMAGFEAIVIDSITHEWDGPGGCLEIHGKMTGNSYTNWNAITPRHNAFINAILDAKAHVICCARAKQDYVIEQNDRGKSTPQKMGLKAVTREGFDYEMTLCFDIDIKHNATSSKDRTSQFADQPPFVISKDTGVKLLAWLNEGADAPQPEPVPDQECTDLLAAIGEQVALKKLTKEQAQEIAGGSIQNLMTNAAALEDVLHKLMAYKGDQDGTAAA